MLLFLTLKATVMLAAATVAYFNYMMLPPLLQHKITSIKENIKDSFRAAPDETASLHQVRKEASPVEVVSKGATALPNNNVDPGFGADSVTYLPPLLRPSPMSKTFPV